MKKSISRELINEMNLKVMYDKLNSLNDDDIVKVKINYLLYVMDMLGEELYNNEEHYDLYVFLTERLETIKLLKKLEKNYIAMKVSDLKFLLDKTCELKIDKSMIYISDRSNKKK